MKKRGPNSSVVCETLEPRRFLSVGDILPAGYATGTKPATITESSVQQGADTIVISGDSIERKTAGGSLDPTFGTNGSVSFPFTPTAVGLASSGQIIVAGNSGTDIYAARLNPDGQFDNSYNGGYATIPLTSGDNYSGTKFVINSSGDVTLIVQGENPTEIQESEDGGLFIVTARLNDAGQLDTTYGDAGFSGFYGDEAGVTFLADGSAVITEDTTFFGQEHDSAATFIDSSGDISNVASLDGLSTGFVVAPISDDQYYLLERYYEDCGLARFNGSTATWSVGSEGQSPLDTTVNQLIPRGGISVNGIIGVATDSQGRAVLAINLDVGGTPGFGFLRFNGDSSLDTTIGTYGLALSALDGDDFQGYGVTVLSNGDYQVSGENTTTNQSETLIFQGTDRGINPIAISTNFSVPTIGRRYGYFTVTYEDTAGTLSGSGVASQGAAVSGPNGEVDAGLVSTTGGGSTIRAKYVFLLDRHGFTRTDNGVYNLIALGDAVTDNLGRGSSGGYVGCYTLYVPRRNRGITSAIPTTPVINSQLLPDITHLTSDSSPDALFSNEG